MKRYRMWIDGGWRAEGETIVVRNPYTGDTVADLPLSGEGDVEDALASSHRAAAAMRDLPTYRRAEILLFLRDGLRARREAFAAAIAVEAGKPLTEARTEVERGVTVLTLAAEEAKRLPGETFALDTNALTTGRFGMTRRFPVGSLVGISPFNFPLNLGLHKLAPALAAGNSFVWKPSLLVPGAACLFAEIVADAERDAGLPPGAVNILTPPDALSERLVTDPRPRMLSFTGSARVGWRLRTLAGTKKVALELGGNAAVIVDAALEDSVLQFALQRCVMGGFAYAGQVCIAVQNILVERALYEEFLARFVPLVEALRVGDPRDAATQVGPMISEKECGRLEQWVAEAQQAGAQVRTGGRRLAAGKLVYAPTVLTDTRPEMRVVCQEAFGPVVTVTPFDTWEEALARVNASAYGLQAGVFTNNLERAFAAYRTLEVGGVIVNDVPTFRADGMPYGGVKESGLGREGVRYAMEEMTEPRLLALNLP